MTDRTWQQDLVDDLTTLADPNNPNRATLAHLRRGLGLSMDYTLARVGWLFRRVPEHDLTAAVLVAGLFAWVKGECRQTDRVNFGAAFGANLTLDEKTKREKRFIDLLDTDADDLPYKLRQAISLVARDRIGFDWRTLLYHLRHWSDSDRRVQTEWARAFWSAPEPTPDVVVQQPISQ